MHPGKASTNIILNFEFEYDFIRCGHCKEFEPTYKKVAKKLLKNNENIVFGKYDGTSNDIPYMFPPLKGFPSLFFVSAYEKFDPIMYQGDRSYKSVKDWINRYYHLKTIIKYVEIK